MLATRGRPATRADFSPKPPITALTPEQQRKVQTLVDVIRIPASSIPGHMNWATFHYRDVVQQFGQRKL